MRRNLIGLFGIAGIAGYFVMCLWQKRIVDTASGSALLRVGLIFCVFWLAMPDLNLLFKKYPPWAVGAGLLLLVALGSSFRAIFFFVLALLLFYAALNFAMRMWQEFTRPAR
jgi:hypothetical protein